MSERGGIYALGYVAVVISSLLLAVEYVTVINTGSLRRHAWFCGILHVPPRCGGLSSVLVATAATYTRRGEWTAEVAVLLRDAVKTRVKCWGETAFNFYEYRKRL